MSTTDPTGEGGGDGGDGGAGGGGSAGESTTTTNVDQNASLGPPITGIAVQSTQAAVQQQQQQQQQQQHPPPSPLSGCYLLVVLAEPHTAQHKDLIVNRLAKGFLSWDKDSCHVDLEKELLALVAQAPEGEEARNGERLIQYATENLVTEVLIHPQTNTLLQCIRNLLASFTKHRHIIHAGYTFGGNGSWILQDGTFSLADFLDAFSEHEVQRVLRAYENSVTVDIHCAGVGDWTTSRLSKEACCRFCRVRVNPDDVLTAGVPAITSFTNYIGQYLVSQTLDQLMEPSDVVGNIRFSHPTLYVFPGGQGDAALFGINGFNMLVDGGFARKACFWDFTRHLDRLDAVLVTRINNSNISGMFSVLRKKKEMHVYPQIGHFFCNLVERRQSNSPDGDKDIDPLILNLTDIGQEMVLNLRHINLRAHSCYRDPDPINLYHKVGHGTLDMYVLSPNKDSREVREFLAKWHASDSKLFAGSHKKDSNNLAFPIQNLVSICALLVWQPANPEDNITRILFPGSTPQNKIFEGFERLKHLDFLKHPVCSAKTLSPSASLATLRDKPAKQKFSLIDKESKRISEARRERRELESKSIKAADETVPKTTPHSTPVLPISKPKTEPKAKKVVENRKIETEAKESKKIEPEAKESKKIEKELKEVRKEFKKEPAKIEKAEKSEKREDDIKKTDLIKAEPDKAASKEPKEPKPKPEPKKKEAKESKSAVKAEMKRSEVTLKQKLSEKRAKLSGAEKKDAVKSSPTTPKKTLNGTATKTEISKTVPKARPAAKVSSLPAKSAKEANNRKVVEQKKSEVEKSAGKEAAAPIAKVSAKPKPMDRKPISRRTKPVSPSKPRMPGSPAKSTRSTPTASVKSDKDGVIRKVKGDKGTTDSSAVSTPSGIEPEVVKPIDKSLREQSEDISLDSIESKVLADLKEEREVVEEIEAVLQKAERIRGTRKDDRFEGDDEITAEATDKKDEDVTEEDVTAEIEDVPKKESSRKESQELTEEDEYLIVEKEEVYTEDSAQSGEGEQKHVLDEAESEKAKVLKDVEAMKEKGEKEEPEKGKDGSPERRLKKIVAKDEAGIGELSTEHKEQLQKEVKEIIASAAEIVQKVEEKDDSGKKDSEDITKEPSSLSPDKLDSSEKKTTDTDIKPDVDQKEQILEKMEESQERISTVESGASTTAPTLPEDERIPLDEIKEDIDEKHVIEEVKEKDAPVMPKEEAIPEVIPEATRPEVKVFDVRQAVHTHPRDIVKTPDEVADLPVHEEVDPKLYKMDDFEKGKEEKSSPTQQETKEPPTPPVKEQKGVFSFFGKVADKFEKGIDKLTKKTKKDSEKDSDEKSSSKSSSPKEPKPETAILDKVDMEKMFPKVSKPIEKSETFEEAKPTIGDVKVAAIKETAAFIQEEILDARRSSMSASGRKLSTVKSDEIKKVTIGAEEVLPAIDISPAVISPTRPDEDTDIEKEEDIGEEAEEVKALLEEASKKFKTVKDSLRDSLESLEDKVKQEEMIVEMQHDVPSALKDAVKDTLEGAAEKLEVIKPHMESSSPDMKEPDKVKFDIPKDEEVEEEFEEELVGPYRDMKEAFRDIGEVLAGTAGIDLEDTHKKDVIEIVKKVAEVLKEDDLLSDKALFEQPPKKEDISPVPTERKPSISSGKASPEHLIEKEIPKIEEHVEKHGEPMAPHKKPETIEVKEELCVKVIKKAEDIVTSPVKDALKDRRDAQKICAEMLKDDQHVCDHHTKPVDDDRSRVDVMQAGIESICVKAVAKRPSFEEKLSEDEIEHPVIGFEQNVFPAKAEIVMVTPGSTPTSPKFSMDKMQNQELDIGYRETTKLPEDVKQVISQEAAVEEVLEELIITRKKKITVEVIEYITVVKRIPRERVIYIIEEIIVRRGLARESVVDDPEVLELRDIMPETRMEIEEYIVNEYVVKGKRITIEVIEEISVKQLVPKKFVIEIIEEIIVKRKIARHMVLDIPEEVLLEIIKEESPEESLEESAEEQITPRIEATIKQKSADKVPSAPTETKRSIIPEDRTEIEELIVDEYISKGKRITAPVIDEISSRKSVPRKILIEIIEEVIVKKEIPTSTILEMSQEELSHIIEEEATQAEPAEAPAEKRKSISEVADHGKKSAVGPTEKDVFEVKEGLPVAADEEDVEEEVDGFVRIPRRISAGTVDSKREGISPVETGISPAAKEHDKDVVDDFEAVEQEYKVRDVPATSPEKADEMREKEDADETAEDTTSEVIEADEKFVQETKGKVGKEEPDASVARDVKRAVDVKRESEEPETSDVSEVADTIEKYLDEDKEKTDDILPRSVAKSISPVSDEPAEFWMEKTDEVKEIGFVFKEKAEKEVERPEHAAKDDESITSITDGKAAEAMKLERKLADATGFAQEPKVEPLKDVKKSAEDAEIKVTPVTTEGEISREMPEEASRKKRSISNELEGASLSKPGDELHIETAELIDAVKAEELTTDKAAKIDDDVGTVKRMLVTASSEDGREETEICPTGSITFTKIVSADDSLKEGSTKSTSDKDSSLLEKDSLFSGVSTPERDSGSEKSQDLEDSLEKLVSSKSKQAPSTDNGKSKMPEESAEKSELPIDKMLPESKKEEVGLHAVDEKASVVVKSRSPSTASEKSEDKESSVRSKSPSIAGDKPEQTDLSAEPRDKSRSSSIVDVKMEELRLSESEDQVAEKSRSPSIVAEKVSRSSSIVSDKEISERRKSSIITTGEVEDDKPIEKSRSPSIIEGKETADGISDDKSLTEIGEKGRDAELEDKERDLVDKESDKPKLPSDEKDMISEKPPIFESEHYDGKGPIDEAKSPSAISDKSDGKKESDRSRSPSIAADKPGFQDVTEHYLEKRKSPIFDRPESPKVIDKTEEPQDKDSYPSVASDKSGSKEVSDRSRSPTVSIEKVDLKGIDPSIEKARSPSVTSLDGDKPKQLPLSKSLTDNAQVPKDELKSSKFDDDQTDSKDTQLAQDKSRSPSVTSETKESILKDKSPVTNDKASDKSKSPEKSRSSSIAGEQHFPGATGLMQEPIETSRSSSVSSIVDGKKDRSKSPSIADEKLDLKDTDYPPLDKSRSSSVASAIEPTDLSKPSSIAGEKPDEKDTLEISGKSRASSVVSITSDRRESVGRSKSPSLAGEKTDLKDVAEQFDDPSLPHKAEEPHDRSKSPSIASEKSDGKKSADGSRATSITEERLDLKDVEASFDKSRSSSVTGSTIEKADPFGKSLPFTASDKLKPPVDRSRSSSTSSDKSDEKAFDDKTGREKYYEDIIGKSPGFVDVKTPDKKDVEERPSTLLGKLDMTSDDITPQPHGKPHSSNIVLDDRKLMGTIDLDRLETSSIISEHDFSDRRSLSIISDKTEPKSPSEASKSPSSVDDKLDQKKSRSSSVASERLDDVDTKSSRRSSEAKKEQAVSSEPRSLDTGNITKDESAKSSRTSSPVDKVADRSRSQSVFDIGEKTPSSRSRTASLFDDKLPEKILPQDEKGASTHIGTEDEDHKSSPKAKSPTTSPHTIQKEMQKIREKRFADFEEPQATQSDKTEKSDDIAEEDIIKVTVEKKAEIERYILQEFIARKKKISLTVIEKLVMMYSVPQFIVMEIIEDIISRENMPRSAVFDFVDEDESKATSTVLPSSLDLERASITQEHLQIHEKPGASAKAESLDGKVSPIGSDRCDRDARLSASSSLTEPIPSDKSTQDSPARSEPHIDDDILMSEEKRTEIEKLVEEEYIKKGRRITEVILEEIIIRTSLPRYIILEIVEEIISKRKMPRESVIDVEIYQEDEPEEDYDKAVYHYDKTRKSSTECRMGMYPDVSDERQLDKSVTHYPDYESQFHKAFVGGMTEMRTTHITTLSGKSTPEFGVAHDAPTEFRPESADKMPSKSPERTLATTHITTTNLGDLESTQPVKTVTILRESKIAEPDLPRESPRKDDKIAEIDEPDQTNKSDGDIVVTEKMIEHEIESEADTKEAKRSSIKQDEPEAITRIIKRQIVEHDEPEVVTKVVKREIIEQDEPEVVTKMIRREIVLPDEETGESKEDADEYMKTITTKTTRTIVTEELPDSELSQTDSSKIYTDSTSGATYRVVSEDGASDTSADVKRIVTTVTTITGPDGKVATKADMKESTVDSEELLKKLIDSGKVTAETTKSAEEIVKETITSVRSGTSTPDMKAFYDPGKSAPDSKQEDRLEITSKERLGADRGERSVSPLVRDLISDDRSYSGKSSPDISLPKDIVFSGSTGKSTPEISMSPLIRDGAAMQPHVSGRSTPDRRSDGHRSSTSTPEGFRSGEMIRTIVTTTKMVSDEGEIVTTTKEVTETTNEKGETVVLAEKTDVKVDERLPSKDAAESAISSIIGSIKSSEMQRSGSPGSDPGGKDSDRDRDYLAGLASRSVTHASGSSSEERQVYSDDEPPSSPLSSTSQIEYSPQPARRHESAFEEAEEEEQKQVEFSTAAMSSSFYGELPAVPSQISAMKTFHGETGMQKSDEDPAVPVHSRFMVEKEFAGGYREKPDAKKYVDEADLDFDKALMEHKEMKESSSFNSGISPRYTNGSLPHETNGAKEDHHPSSSFRDDSKDDSKGDSKKDPVEGWGTPLGLPSPKPPRKFNLKNPAQASCSSEASSDTLNFDVTKEWGEPLRLPSPAPVTNEVSNKGAPGTPKKERNKAKKVQSENMKNWKRSESPGKNEKRMKDSKNKVQPVYMDLAYVPHHGNSYYTSLEFFKRVRARYYVFSGTEPSREVYDALLEAKRTWEDKDLEVTMIPTYDTDTLGYWVADNEEALAANRIDLSPSASRCTINLQDHETSCSAYRLEF